MQLLSIEVKFNYVDGSSETITFSGASEQEIAVKVLNHATAHYTKIIDCDAITPVIMVGLPVGIIQLDDEKLQARFKFLGITGAPCNMFRYFCMGYTNLEMTVLDSKIKSAGSIHTQFSILKGLIGDFSPREFKDIFTCSNLDYNIRYHLAIENFKQTNDCRYKKQNKLAI